MRVKIGDRIYDSSNEPIMLIFESDADRIKFANYLVSMVEKEGIRKVLQAPDIMTKESIKNFMNII